MNEDLSRRHRIKETLFQPVDANGKSPSGDCAFDCIDDEAFRNDDNPDADGEKNEACKHETERFHRAGPDQRNRDSVIVTSRSSGFSKDFFMVTRFTETVTGA